MREVKCRQNNRRSIEGFAYPINIVIVNLIAVYCRRKHCYNLSCLFYSILLINDTNFYVERKKVQA